MAPSSALGHTVKPLTGVELVTVAASVLAAYGGGLYGLHCWGQAVGKQGGGAESHSSRNFWGTLPSAWDHPEPNYVVSESIGEFWSVLTTIPVAGALLVYEGLKYGYGSKVLRIYAMTCIMYSLAFTAHLTLQKVIFSTTVTMVMTNALLTFAQFSYIVHKTLRSPLVRGAVVLVAEIALVGTVATLPYALAANGGVWTLFIVQSPGVFLATGIAQVMTWLARQPQECVTYRIVRNAGLFLSTAMALSCVECLVGFEHGFIDKLWGFPWLHIIIHVAEQIGIYVFGVGVAALHEMVLEQPARVGAEVRYVGGFMAYLYCPYHAGAAPQGAEEPATAAAWPEDTAGGLSGPKAAEEEEACRPHGVLLPGATRGRGVEPKWATAAGEPGTPASTEAPTPASTAESLVSMGSASSLEGSSPRASQHPTMNRRRRDKTPAGLTAPRQEPQVPPSGEM